MARPSNEQVVRRYVEAVVANDDKVLAALRHPDWSVEWPQSGERVRGHANDRAIIENCSGLAGAVGRAHRVNLWSRASATALVAADVAPK